MRGTGTGTINLTTVPPEATITKAYLYWSTLGTDGTFMMPTLNGTAVTGTRIGQSDDPWWGVSQAFIYRADVTSLVTGNGTYTIAGLPAGPLPPANLTVNDSEGANLVVLYDVPGAPQRVITINDGAVTLTGSRVAVYRTPLTGFVAADPPTGAKLIFLVGDGQSITPEYAGLNTTLLSTNEFSGSDGDYWDTRTYERSGAIAAGATHADSVLSTGYESLVWVAAILSVPGDASMHALTVNKEGSGTGTVASAPAGIDCGSTCSAAFEVGATVTLTATPTAGQYFTGWSGEGSNGTGTCAVTMTQSRTVTATFDLVEPPKYLLSISLAGCGEGAVTSSPAGISCPGDCSENYYDRTAVTLTAGPGPGTVFGGWSVDGGACPALSNGGLSCTVGMTQARNINAIFRKVFTDDPLSPRVTLVKAIHVTELRQCVDTLRGRAGLPVFAWTDPTLTVRSTKVKAQHLTELRTALRAVYTKAGQTPPTYTDLTLTARVTLIKAIHINELRTAVRGLE